MAAFAQRDVDTLIGGLVIAAVMASRDEASRFLDDEASGGATRRSPEANRMLGPHRLSISDAALLEETAGGSLSTDLARVGPILDEEDHVHIYVGPAIAHVVRRRKMTDGDLPTFVATLQGRIPRSS